MEQVITGTVIAVDLQHGVSKAGKEWRKVIFVIEFMDGSYTKHLAFEMFGDDRIANNPVKKGELVNVYYDVESNEWNGRWFTTASAWKVIPADGTAVNTGFAPIETPSVLPDNSDLPF